MNAITRDCKSVPEQDDVIFEIDDYHIFDNVADGLQHLWDTRNQQPLLNMTCIQGKFIISGSIRAWLELFAFGSLAGRYFIGHFDPAYVIGNGFLDEDAEPDPRVKQIYYADLVNHGGKLTI